MTTTTTTTTSSTHTHPGALSAAAGWDEALDLAGVALAVLDPAGHVAAATAAYCRLTGREASSVPGTLVLDWWGSTPDTNSAGDPGAPSLGPAPSVSAVLAAVAAGGVHLDVELHGETSGPQEGRQDGRQGGRRGVLRVEVTGHAGGGAVLLLRDVTAEVAERTSLRTRLAQQEAVMSASPDTIYRLHLGTGHVEWTNSGGACLLGLPAVDDLVAADLVHPDDASGVERAVETLRAAAPGEIVECTYRVVDTWGEERWVHTRSTVTDLDAAGRALHAVGIAQDLTETITTMDALAGSERRFHEVFARGPVGMLIFGLEGWISEVNDALCTLLERDTAELVGAAAAELLEPAAGERASAQERDELAQAHAQLQALIDGSAEVAHRERRFDLPSGRTVWAQVTLSLTSSSTGEPAFLAFVEDVTARKREAEQLEHAALHDPLTGLPNRAKAEDQLGSALARTQRRGGGCAVLFVDLDHFKDVNDTLGHAAGDHLLRDVADRLRGLLRTGDTAARIGGDEFVLVCEDVADAQALSAIAERVCERITIPVDLGARTVTVTASVGAARTDGSLGPDELLRAADRAMYRAKAAGRACWRAA
ncbi:diguanylate cyclase domain-containing protein [Kineococcus sp. DHX-1]|uniref:diguanylate cyclase domain-containing protein n=1 Tax=Kineococcus sp. DHX-1 TaxID=3349638 RepID=UPI0036D2FD0A